jgi:hypothetical protein
MSDKYAGGIKAGSTSVSTNLVLRKTADNTELTGIVFGGVTATYRRQGASGVAITTSALGSVSAAYSSGGWFEADATNRPGEYRLDIPDAAFATGADFVVIAVKVASAYVYYERFALESKGAAEVSSQLTAGVTVTTNSDKAGYALTSGEHTNIAADTQTGLTAQGFTTARAPKLDNLDVATSTRLATAGYTAPDNADIALAIASVGSGLHTELDAVKAQTDKFTFTGSNVNAQSSGTVQLAANGLDLIVVETGINVRQALAPILAAAAGTLSGATTSTVAIAAAGSPSTTRITASVDGSGNRTAVTLNLPA